MRFWGKRGWCVGGRKNEPATMLGELWLASPAAASLSGSLTLLRRTGGVLNPRAPTPDFRGASKTLQRPNIVAPAITRKTALIMNAAIPENRPITIWRGPMDLAILATPMPKAADPVAFTARNKASVPGPPSGPTNSNSSIPVNEGTVPATSHNQLLLFRVFTG